MPVLDAKALRIDPNGMEFLRDILRRDAQETERGSKVRLPSAVRDMSKAADFRPKLSQIA